MKKISNKGFVLAETIVVAVFMVTIFTVLYSNYFPIMANYEKREYYDDIDSKYIAFWLKYIIQDSAFDFGTTVRKDSANNDLPHGVGPSPDKSIKDQIRDNGYAFFSCGYIHTGAPGIDPNYFNNLSKKNICNKLTKEAGINGMVETGEAHVGSPYYCTSGTSGSDSVPCNGLDDVELGYVAIITNYQLDACKEGTETDASKCFQPRDGTKIKKYLKEKLSGESGESTELITNLSDGMIDYIFSLPNYTNPPANSNTKYRLILELVDVREKDRKPLYKYANIEVVK